MRKLLVAVLTGALVVGAVGVAEAAQRQAIRGVTVPKKMGKFRYSWASLRVLTATWDTTGAQPSPANRAIIDLDNDIWINTFGLPRCALNRIQGQTFQVARNRCRRAIVGYGNATAQLGGATIPVTVTAFNGRPQGRRPTIYLHSDPGFDPQVLVGVLLRRAPGRDYGTRVVITIPLAGRRRCLARALPRQDPPPVPLPRPGAQLPDRPVPRPEPAAERAGGLHLRQRPDARRALPKPLLPGQEVTSTPPEGESTARGAVRDRPGRIACRSTITSGSDNPVERWSEPIPA